MLDKQYSTAAIILAAGKASRFGSSKQLLILNGKTLLEHSISNAQAAGCHPIIIVTGASHQEICDLILPQKVTILHNSDWQNGMGHSLAFGVKTLDPKSTDAVLIILADQPAISSETLLKLRAKFAPPETSIVLSQNSTSKGPPALFSNSHFPALCQLTQNEGAKSIINQHPNQTAFIDAPETIWDIDTNKNWQDFLTFLADSNT